MIERVTFTSRNGDQVAGALALPAGDQPAPAVIVIHEWWGLNAQIEQTAERLASEGFVVLAPDLYRGVTTKDAAEAGRLMNELDGNRAIADIGGALDYLKGHARSTGKVAITGFCMGGAYTFGAACFVRGLSAAVPFYGIPPKPDWSQVDVPIMAHVARRDGWVTPAAAEAIHKTLTDRGVQMDLHVYEADHAFMNENRPEVYDAESARLAWTRTVEFLKSHTA